jgi:putative aldouronate transport system substrate-binding protein
MPNSEAAASSSAPSRRTFLASTAVVAAAVAGGVPLLSACASSAGSSKEGTTSGKDLKRLLPTYVASRFADPDIPSKNGSAVGYTKALLADQLKSSVPEKLGKGGKYTIMAPLWGTPPKNDCAYYTAMNKAIGVGITWQNQDGNTYDEKLGAVLAGSEIPDVVVIPSWELGGKIPSAINNKFADLGPYLSGDKVKDYPNLAAIPTSAWQRSVFGGALRGLPMPASDIPNIVPFYREDIFDAKKYELPTSADEFLALARDITSAKSKVWACDDMKWTAFNIFGVMSGSEKPLGWNLVDGKLVYRVETDEFLEALEWTRKLFAAGVVHPDAKAAQGDAGNRFTAGQVLIYNQDISHWYAKTIEQQAQNPDFRIMGMDIFGHDGGDPALYAGVPAGIWAFVNKKASEEQIRDILAIANFTAAPYGTKEQRMRQYGVEGTHYTMKNGVPVKNDLGNTEVMASYEFMASPAPTVAYPDHPEIVEQVTGWQQRMGAFVTKTSFYGMQITEPTRWANLSDGFEDLEDSIVRGRKKVGDMQQAVSEWKRSGGDKLRDWYQKLLDETGSAAS